MLFKTVFHTYVLLVFAQMFCSTLVRIQIILPIEEGASTICENVLGIALCYFVTTGCFCHLGECFTTLTDGRDFYEAQKALLLFTKRFARWMREKPMIKTHKVARRRRNF